MMQINILPTHYAQKPRGGLDVNGARHVVAQSEEGAHFMALFLYRDRLIELLDTVDPKDQSGFPLNPEQYEKLTLHDLMELLTEGLSDNPALAEDEPRFVLAICHMLYDKGQVNAVRVMDDGAGPVLSCAKIPAQSLDVLDELRMRGALNQKSVDEAVWNPLA